MEPLFTHTIDNDKFIIEFCTNRFTHDLVSKLTTEFPYSEISAFHTIQLNLQQVKMIDSSAIGYMFELHNKLKAEEETHALVISVGSNRELKDLLHRFQVDLMLNVQ